MGEEEGRDSEKRKQGKVRERERGGKEEGEDRKKGSRRDKAEKEEK